MKNLLHKIDKDTVIRVSIGTAFWIGLGLVSYYGYKKEVARLERTFMEQDWYKEEKELELLERREALAASQEEIDKYMRSLLTEDEEA